MLQARPEGYVGKQFTEGFTSYFVAGHYYGVLSIEDGMNQDEGKQLLERFKEGLLSADVSDLTSFESTVSNLILSLNFPAHVALAIGTEIEGILYVKTIGEGQIYFRRGKQFDQLISGDRSGSGYLKEFDLAVFTTTKIQDVIGAAADIQAFVDMSPPQNIIEKINGEEYGEEETGFVALFVEFSKRDSVNTPSILDEVGPKINDPLSEKDPEQESREIIHPQEAQYSQSGMPMVDMADYPQKRSENKLMHFIRSKAFIIVTIIVLFGLLTWSVVFGVQRRNAAELDKKVETTQVEIQKKLDQAKDEAFLNMDQSLVLLSDAKTQYEQLKQEIGDSRAQQIAEIKTMIDDAESSILKREEKPFDEFYDLALDAKDAKADAVGKEGDVLAILDTTAKKIYVLDLQKKSLEEYVNSDVTDATSVTIYNDEVFFLNPEKGVMKFTSQSKVKPLIEADDEWGKITDIEIYNGNIYLLDSGNSDIYKYLVTEGGYSDKNSYFGSAGTSGLDDATAMAIDSAVYVSTKTDLHKYISGAPESFSPTFPNENPQFDGIYTSADDEQVYVLDTAQASVYMLTKEGEYQRTIQSSAFAKASGIYVFEGKVHVVSGGKIFSVSLD